MPPRSPGRRSWPRVAGAATTRSRPARSGRTETCTAPASSAARRDGLGLPFADLDHERAAGPQPAGRLRAQRAVERHTAHERLEGVRPHLGAAASRTRRARCRAGCSRPGRARPVTPASRPCSRSLSSTSTSRSRRPALRRARATASDERSTAHTRASGRSCLIASAMAPRAGADVDDGRRRPPLERLERGLDHHLGLGTRHEHPRPHDQREMAEPRLAVRCWVGTPSQRRQSARPNALASGPRSGSSRR